MLATRALAGLARLLSIEQTCSEMNTPPPSSIAPNPTSQESRWPESRTISSGNSEPTTSTMVFRDGAHWSVAQGVSVPGWLYVA